jgi:hypothetical protein
MNIERATEERVEAEVEAYASDAGSLADLCSTSHALLLAILTHVLADVDGIEVHIERLIEADKGAMERIRREAEKAIADHVNSANDNAAEYAAMCREDAA